LNGLRRLQIGRPLLTPVLGLWFRSLYVWQLIISESDKNMKGFKNTSKGFLQSGAMADHLNISTGCLATWRKAGKIRMSSYVEPSNNYFLYNVVSVENDLILATEETRRQRYESTPRWETVSVQRDQFGNIREV